MQPDYEGNWNTAERAQVEALLSEHVQQGTISETAIAEWTLVKSDTEYNARNGSLCSHAGSITAIVSKIANFHQTVEHMAEAMADLFISEVQSPDSEYPHP
jgi:hypothetical protein